MLTIDSTQALNGFKGALFPYSLYLTAPLRTMISGIDQAVIFLTDLQRVQLDNLSAQKRINEYEREQKRLADIESENKYLREQLKIMSERYAPGILARVARYEFNPDAGYVILQLERPRPIVPGQAVTSGRQLVGFVDQALGESYVRVQMINASNYSRAVVLGEKKLLGQWVGHAGLSTTIENVPIESSVSVGDLVQLATTDKYAKDYYLGKVSEVVADDANPLQQISAKPLIDLYSLDYVIILEQI